jgi:hypothetical protein
MTLEFFQDMFASSDEENNKLVPLFLQNPEVTDETRKVMVDKWNDDFLNNTSKYIKSGSSPEEKQLLRDWLRIQRKLEEKQA